MIYRRNRARETVRDAAKWLELFHISSLVNGPGFGRRVWLQSTRFPDLWARKRARRGSKIAQRAKLGFQDARLLEITGSGYRELK